MYSLDSKFINPSFSVATVTLNAAEVLPRLINSLRSQTDKDFVWVVFDGGSTDDTLELINKCGLTNFKLTSGNDFGIYDALNQCLDSVYSDYYIVCGADDELFPTAIASYRSEAQKSDGDIISACIEVNEHIRAPRRDMGWLYCMEGISSSHSVGMAIRLQLHKQFGKYSRKLPIAADQLFVKKVHRGGGKFHHSEFIAGRYSTGGTSGADMLGMLTEAFRVQRLTERSKFIQVLLFIVRLLKHYRQL